MNAPDHAQRRLIVERLDATMLVEAAAGTGKTRSMTDRMVALLAGGKCRIETLVAVTFTRKAAAELQNRFQLALEDAARRASGKPAERSAPRPQPRRAVFHRHGALVLRAAVARASRGSGR